MKLETKKRITEKIKFIIPAALLFVVGVGMLVCLSYHEYRITNEDVQSVYGSVNLEMNSNNSFEVEKQNLMSHSSEVYYNIVKPIVYNVAIIMIVLSIGTMLFELFGYLSFFRKRIAEVFTRKELVNILSNDYKKELKFNLLQSIYKLDTEDKSAILNLFDNQLSDVLQTYYYNLYDLHMECCIDDIDGKKYITKRITKHIELKEMDSRKKNYYSTLINFSCKEIPNSKKDVLTIHSIRINGELLENRKDYQICDTGNYSNTKFNMFGRRVEKKVKKDKNASEFEPYPKTIDVSLVKPIEINKNLIVDVDYTTIVPIEDKLYSFKTDLLCKEVRATVGFKKDEFEVLGNGFKFSTESKNDFVFNHHETLTEISTRKWLLPGEGLIFTFFMK